MKIRIAVLAFLLLSGTLVQAQTSPSAVAGETYTLESPDGVIIAEISVGERITYSVTLNGNVLLERASVGYEINSRELDYELVETQRDSKNETITPVTAVKSNSIPNVYNELALVFADQFVVRFRAFNNGLAHRLETTLDGDIIVSDEWFDLEFPGGSETWYPVEESFFSSNEKNYTHTGLDTLATGTLASLPALFGTSNGHKIIIMESGLHDYAGMWLLKTEEGISAAFPRYPDKVRRFTDRYEDVVTRKSYIAATAGTRTFPWRILGIAETDTDLLTNDLVYTLADETVIETDWIKPGKVAWDWWNAWNVKGVDFKSGPNTDTYKFYIDFASANGIEYVILDEGWYILGDLLHLNDEIDVKELIRYGETKNVGIVLWVVWRTLDDQFEEALDAFEEWGAKGIKVDFMNRDDQWMVNYYEKVAKAAAERHLLVDFHGAYKPSGIRRKYPNVITREGVLGLEYNKWSADVTPTHNVTIPFIRMVPGPIDYTPGGMTNTQPGNFRVSHFRPMVMGTRAAEIAKFVVFESPFQMLADTPTNYMDEQESTDFISAIPTTWDETIPLEGKVGEYIAMARRKGDLWYIGVMSNEASRNLTLDLGFLGRGTFEMEYIRDGINAGMHAEDYKKETRTVRSQDKIEIELAPAGGWAAIIRPN